MHLLKPTTSGRWLALRNIGRTKPGTPHTRSTENRGPKSNRAKKYREEAAGQGTRKGSKLLVRRCYKIEDRSVAQRLSWDVTKSGKNRLARRLSWDVTKSGKNRLRCKSTALRAKDGALKVFWTCELFCMAYEYCLQ